MEDELKESGTILYLREHTKATNKLNITLCVLGYSILAIILWLIWYIIHNNVYGNTLRIIGGC